MPRTLPAFTFAASLAALTLPATGVLAQSLPVGATVTSAAITGLAQLDADLDRGGEFHGSGVFVSANVLRQFTPALTAGLNLRYDYEEWSFSGGSAFGVAPWKRLHRPGVGVPLVYAAESGLRFTAIPSDG